MVAKIFNRLGSLSEKHPWWVIAACILLTAVAVAGMVRIKQEFGYKAMLPQQSESVKTLNEADKIFGGTVEEQVLLESDNVLEPAVLRKVAGFKKALEAEKGLWPGFANGVTTPLDDMVYVQPQPVASLEALGASLDPVTAGLPVIDQATAEPLLDKVPALSDAEVSDQVKLNLWLADVRARQTGYAAMRTVSWSGQVPRKAPAMLLNVRLNPKQGTAQQLRDVVAFEEFTRAYFSGVVGDGVFISGQASMNKDSSERTMGDTKLLFLLALVFIVIVLAVTFRRVTDVLFTLLVILVTVVWVEGLGGWLGFPFGYTSAAILPLLLGIDIAYAIHVLSRYYEERGKGADPHKSALNSVVTVGVAVFLTAATTAFGFASFGISNMPPIQQFGALCVAGVLFSFVLAVTLLPAVLVLRDRREWAQRKWDKRQARLQNKEREGWLDRFLVRIAILSEHHRTIVFVITGIILVACVVLGFRLTTEADMEKMMPRDMPFIKANERIDKYFGGQDMAFTLVKGKVLEPATLNAMLAYEDGLAGSKEVSSKGDPLFERDKMFSIADLVEKVNGSIPATRAEVVSVLMKLSTGSKSEQQNTLMNPEYPDVTMVSVRVPRGNSDDMKRIAETMRDKSAEVVMENEDIAMNSSGLPILMNEVMGSIAPTQIKTSVVALVLCALIVVIVFGSIFFGLAATSVVFLGIALEIGALALLNWPLDFMTVMVSSLVIGAGIDFGIHVTHRFREEWHQGGVEIDEAMRRTIGNVGKALVAAAVTTAGAFGIIAISEISYLRRFGGITALSLTFALLAALLFLPSVLAWKAERVERKKARAAM